MRTPMGNIRFLAFLLAAMTPDVVDSVYFLASFCNPTGLYSHTIYAVLLEMAVVSGTAFLATGSRSVALGFALVVLLHSPADYFTGYKLFVPGGELHGLDFYNRPPLDFLLEAPTIVLGWWLLRRSGRAPRWARSVWAVGVILFLQLGFDARTGLNKPSSCESNPAGVLVAAR